MARKTERCDRCEEDFPELLPTSHGWLCEDCAWMVTDRDGDGQVYADLAGLYYGPEDGHLVGLYDSHQSVEQGPDPETQAWTQQGQL